MGAGRQGAAKPVVVIAKVMMLVLTCVATWLSLDWVTGRMRDANLRRDARHQDARVRHDALIELRTTRKVLSREDLRVMAGAMCGSPQPLDPLDGQVRNFCRWMLQTEAGRWREFRAELIPCFLYYPNEEDDRTTHALSVLGAEFPAFREQLERDLADLDPSDRDEAELPAFREQLERGLVDLDPSDRDEAVRLSITIGILQQIEAP